MHVCGHTGTEMHIHALHEEREQICEKDNQEAWGGCAHQVVMGLLAAGGRSRENVCLEERMPCADIKAWLPRRAMFILLLAGMDSHSNHSKALQKAWHSPALLGAGWDCGIYPLPILCTDRTPPCLQSHTDRLWGLLASHRNRGRQRGFCRRWRRAGMHGTAWRGCLQLVGLSCT